MVSKFKKGIQKKIIVKAISKAGSERALSEALKIPKGSIYRYKSEIDLIPQSRLNELLLFLGYSSNWIVNNIVEEKSLNWGQIKGGKKRILNMKLNGTFDDHMIKLKKASSIRLKEWHRRMRTEFPKEYYLWQYERFKKIKPGYKLVLNNGTFVRNSLERKVGNYLIKMRFQFEYEPYLNLNGKAYFPDFKINNLLIECTSWKYSDNLKFEKLKFKIKDYQKNGFIVVIFIPKKLRKLYKECDCPLISALLDLKEYISASVA